MKNKNSFLTVLLVGALMLSPTKTMAQSNVVGEAIGLGVELLGGLFSKKKNKKAKKQQDVITPIPNNIDQNVSQEKIISGELGIFNLYGPVKSVVITNKTTMDGESWENIEKYTFDRNGYIQTFKDYNMTYFLANSERDAKRRLIKISYDGEIEYRYDDLGRLVYESETDGQFFDTELEYEYDEIGYVKTMRKVGSYFTNPDEEDGYTDIVINCTVLQCDEYGNWIKRKDIYNNGWSVIITRTISYY